METFRGGILFLVRWLIHYPIVHGTYRLRNWTRSPYRLQPELAEKPGILVSNYWNYWYDDMIGMMLAPVVPFVFVRAPLCRIPFFKYVYRFFRALPIIRTNDVAYSPEERVAENEKTFAYVADLLRKGHWLSTFPEQQPGNRSKLETPFKPGVAHVALRAEDAAGWGLGLRIYVYGTNYENKFASRSNVYLRWATPIEVAKYREQYERDPVAAERALMEEVEQSLHATVLEAPAIEQIEAAHRLAYQRGNLHFQGIQSALSEVTAGKASPEQLRKIVCRKGRESLVYQVLGFGLFGVGWALGWPFRMFGKLCATEKSQEMTFQFILWSLVLITGAFINESHWAKVQIVATWSATNMWLWGWRRGVVDTGQ